MPEIELVPILEPVALVTHVFVKSEPAFAIGAIISTVTKTLSDAVQPFNVFVAIKE